MTTSNHNRTADDQMERITTTTEISARDLREEADAALTRGEAVWYARRAHHRNPELAVETIVLEDLCGRAGQAINADAMWGEAMIDDDVDGGIRITLDDGGVVLLDGSDAAIRTALRGAR